MEENNLIQIYKTFSKKEMRDFELFVISPFFNKNQNVIKLFRLLKQNYPEFTEKPDKKKLHTALFPKKNYNENNMKTMFYLLNHITEEYLVYLLKKLEPFNRTKALFETFYLRKLNRHFEKLEKKTVSALGEIEGSDAETMRDKISFEKVRRFYYIGVNEEEKIYNHEFKYSEHNITVFFIELFRIYSALKRLKYLNFDKGFNFITEIMKSINFERLIELLREYQVDDMQYLETYYSMYKSLSEPENDKYYEEFKSNLLNNGKHISKREQYLLSTLLISASFYRHLTDRVKYTRELFEAYKILLSHFEYSEEVYLLTAIYTTILKLGLQLHEYEWIEEFMQENIGRLQPDHQENMRNYSRAYLSFARREFDKSLEYISKVDFANIQMRYDLRNRQLMIYYEIADFEAALSLSDAYKHFIKKEKSFSKKIKDGYLTFIAYTLELFKMRAHGKPYDTGPLKDKIETENPTSKQWLLEKIQELEEK